MKQQSTAAVSQHLTNMANELIDSFVYPADLITFLTECANRMHTLELENKGDNGPFRGSHYMVLLLMETVALPWLKAKESPENIVAAGLVEMYQYAHYEGWLQLISALLMGYAQVVEDGGWGKGHAGENMAPIISMLEMGQHMHLHHLDNMREREPK